MNILVIVIFVLLIGYVFSQRRQIAFLKQINHNQETLHILTEHRYTLLKHRSTMLELALNVAGYDVERFNKGDYTKIEPSPAKCQQIWEEFQRLQSIDRSEEIKFEVEMELDEGKS